MELKPGYKQTEVGVIPEDWEVKPLNALADKIMVGIASAATHAYRERGIVLFRNQNIKPGYLDDSDILYIATDYEAAFKNKRLRAGDLLTARTGYPGTTCVVPPQYESAQSFTTLITRPNRRAVDSNYLCCFINSIGGQTYFEQNQIGGGQKNVNAGSLKQLPVPLPPTKGEQEAIAAALNDADALIECLEQLISKKRQLKQGTMQELLTGEKRLPGFSGANTWYKQTDVGLVPEDWEVAKLDDYLSEQPAYGINAPAVKYQDSLPTYVRITDITDDGRFSSAKLVSVNAANAADYFLEDGDLVFARTGASVGKSYRYVPTDGRLVFAGFLIRVRPNPSRLSPPFLAAFATTWQYWNWVRLMSMRSGQPGINGNEYAQLPIPRPTIDEQIAIAAVLTDMDAEIAALEAKLAKTRKLMQGMMHNLLTGRIRLVGSAPIHLKPEPLPSLPGHPHPQR